MDEQIPGIVLKNQCKVTPTFSVLTAHYGRIALHDRRMQKRLQYIRPGSFIFFSCDQKDKWNVRNIEVYSHPSLPSSFELYWHHHILELVYYFVPLQEPSQEIFDHVYTLLSIEQAPVFFWKAGVITLFTLLGYHPPASAGQHQEHFASVCRRYWNQEHIAGNAQIRIPYDVVFEEYNTAELDSWIMRTMAEHPYYAMLKTQQFFTQLYPKNGIA